MKFIDLLVHELPKRGGWPDGVECIEQYIDNSLFDYNGWASGFKIERADDYDYGVVTRTQYESALAASRKVEWDGVGLPPVGCECEFISNDISWGVVKVIGFDGEKVVIRPSGETYYAITPSYKEVFIPFRTEEEKKRDIVVVAIKELFKHGNDPRVDDATLIFNAIAAGKIPGVKLED
jgi:hypothetical protein